MNFKQQDIQNVKTTHDSKGESFKHGDPIAFFHTFKNEGQIQYQGFIDTVEASGNVSGVLFSFFDGSMNGRINIVKSELENCEFYGSDAEMNSNYTRLSRLWEDKQQKLRDAI